MGGTSDWSHQIVLAAEPVSASLARDFVSLHLAAHDLRDLVEDMRLVVSELATNAVAHARTPFVVTLSRAHRTVLVVIQDESTSVPVSAAPDAMDISGRGLMIVELLSHEWGTSTDARGSKSVWASFRADPNRAAQPTVA
jgi:anti-sigma regulatory factor (Ser/Thr protein kinase)